MGSTPPPVGQAQFDQDLSTAVAAEGSLADATQALVTASQAYRAAVVAQNNAGGPPLNLAAEDAELNNALAKVQAATTAATGETTALGSAPA